MTKDTWDKRDPPEEGDPSIDITFAAVGRALSQWELFEGHLSLMFSYLIGSGYGNVAALRAYGSVESFRGRSKLIDTATEVYFRLKPNKDLEERLYSLTKVARNQAAARRNEIAHGIANLYVKPNPDGEEPEFHGYVLYPAYYATKKRVLPETGPLEIVKMTYIYSSNEIDHFKNEFEKLADEALNVLTDLTSHDRIPLARLR
jgi:hypothetical protein